jgi:thioesterase domain-containing protein
VENGKIVYRKSVRETAKILYRNLVDFYPRGPYLLIGYSASGYFTVELARLLIRGGHELAFAGLLDTFPPGVIWQIDQIDRVKFHISNLKGKNFPEILEYLGSSFQHFSIRLRHRVTNARKIEHYEEMEQMNEVRQLLTDAYKPEPFEEKITLFSAIDRPMQIHGDPMEGWTNIFSGPFEIVPVPGGHSSMLKPPHVAVLAELIKACLPDHDNN